MQLFDNFHACGEGGAKPVLAALPAANGYAWQQVPLDIRTDYAQSMPERIKAVIDAKGDSTKY
jgi:hypothetical protein